MIFQYIIIAIIVGLAVWFLVNKLRAAFSSKSCAGACGCAKSEINNLKT